MSQAKPKMFGGRLKRNEQCFKDVPSETENVGRQIQTKRAMFQGCLKRNPKKMGGRLKRNEQCSKD
eukprot:3734455-Pyramimonas_sp.AAC.1